MTHEEMLVAKAIESLNGECKEMDLQCDCKRECNVDSCFIKLAIKALAKQIPQKPKEESMYPWCECGCLLASESLPNYQYCPDCGQKIDWSEEE